jgi:uroporphyrinogen-III decarboxylase
MKHTKHSSIKKFKMDTFVLQYLKALLRNAKEEGDTTVITLTTVEFTHLASSITEAEKTLRLNNIP